MKFAILTSLIFVSNLSLAQDAASKAAPQAMDQNAADQGARKPASTDLDAEQKKLNEAAANKDERAVVEAATHILGVDSKNLRALNALAVYYYNQGKFGLSRLILLRAVHDNPDNPALENNLGMISLAEGKQKAAIASFRHATELKSSYPQASCNLGAIFLDYKDYKKAADMLKAGYEAYKSDLKKSGSYGLEVANNYAVALSGSGDLDQANQVFKKIMRVDDSNPSTLYNYAVLLVARMKNKKDGEKIIAKLKLVADSSLDKKVSDLEKLLSDGGNAKDTKESE
jgi:Flp pilus assembly protein TadD